MKRENLDSQITLTPEQQAALAALDGEPDTADIPEAPAAHWGTARRLYRPSKQPISIRLDTDILDWIRRRHAKYQVEINRILRESMEADRNRQV